MTARDELMSALFLADPETAAVVQDKLSARLPPVTDTDLALIVAETIRGLSLETGYGQAIAAGFIEIAGRIAPELVEMFRSKVRDAGEKNAAIGRIMAIHLVPVLKTANNRLIEKYFDTTDALLKIGTYTLGSPLEALSYLLESEDIASSLAFLALLESVLSPELSYNQCKHLCHILPNAVRLFSHSRRLFQTGQLMRIACADPGLVDGFLDGMQRGTALLDSQALARFVSAGLTRFSHDKAAGARFLSLESRQALDLVSEIQIAACFSEIRQWANRYLQARTGKDLFVLPLSELSQTDGFTPEPPQVCSCGNRIYLPDEISCFKYKPANLFLYKCLIRLEAGYHEFGTYEFDLEIALDACGDSTTAGNQRTGNIEQISQTDVLNGGAPEPKNTKDTVTASDMSRFCRIFPNPALAADLMTVFEHGRIRVILEARYPGIVRQSLPVLIGEANRMHPDGRESLPLEALYAKIALGMRDTEIRGIPSKVSGSTAVFDFDGIVREFYQNIDKAARVEDCAVLVRKSYSRIESCLKAAGRKNDHRLSTPFGRGLRPDLAMDTPMETKAAHLKQRLAENGITVHKSKIRKLLMQRRGKIGRDDILKLIRTSQASDMSKSADHAGDISLDLADPDLSAIPGLMDSAAISDTLPATWYREWDSLHSDYLHNHVRVVDRIAEGAAADFYEQTLERYPELISQIRYAFELMKPRGLKLLRNWTEGDELDYRAVLDFVLDKKAGLIPSDRLYVKRIKQERNVAVLLLVDLSRSTGNTLESSPSRTGATILDIEKEAMVLFCEALDILGDTFAIAGFSGNGRLSVDFTHIKEFDEPLNKAVRRRISGLAPQRGTRMGAAIRHATARFDKIPAGVKLMVILGDGFPNDVDYKQGYAVSDTRKAIGEAFSRRIHTHAVTVNMHNDARLDDLYGNVHHNVISDVRELPARLPRIYGALTRSRSSA